MTSVQTTVELQNQLIQSVSVLGMGGKALSSGLRGVKTPKNGASNITPQELGRIKEKQALDKRNLP